MPPVRRADRSASCTSPATDDCGALDTDPMPDRGLAAVRINYPYQAATLSGYQSAPPDVDPIPPNMANFITADDGGVQQTERSAGRSAR